jgi:DNA-binding response OmpR family regulator
MHILIVEDEPGIQAFLKQGLEEEGYKITLLSDGESASDFLKKQQADLILLDWMLPKKMGIDVLQEFRLYNQLTPVIMLTAKDRLEDTIDGLKTGANDYIKKPFHFEELLQRIRVQERFHKKQELLTLGMLRIDKQVRAVYVSDSEIHLTQKEYDLLVYLIQNQGRICTRKEIIEQVWDIHFDYDTSVLDVYMTTLRKKLNLTPENNILHTIRGIGFIAKVEA